MKTKNKHILKNNAVGKYIYDKPQNNSKRKLLAKQSGGTKKLPMDILLNMFDEMDCHTFYNTLVEYQQPSVINQYYTFFNEPRFFKKVVSCTIEWRKNVFNTSGESTPEEKYYGKIRLFKGELVWCKINSKDYFDPNRSELTYSYVLGNLINDWYPPQVVLIEQEYSNGFKRVGKGTYGTSVILNDKLFREAMGFNSNDISNNQTNIVRCAVDEMIPKLFAIDSSYAAKINEQIPANASRRTNIIHSTEYRHLRKITKKSLQDDLHKCHKMLADINNTREDMRRKFELDIKKKIRWNNSKYPSNFRKINTQYENAQHMLKQAENELNLFMYKYGDAHDRDAARNVSIAYDNAIRATIVARYSNSATDAATATAADAAYAAAYVAAYGIAYDGTNDGGGGSNSRNNSSGRNDNGGGGGGNKSGHNGNGAGGSNKSGRNDNGGGGW